MINLTWMVLMWCVSVWAWHVGDAIRASTHEPVGPDMGYQVWNRLVIPEFCFMAPSENHALKLSYVETYNELSRRFLLQQGVTAPLAIQSGTLSLNLHVDERTIPQGLWAAADRWPTVVDASATAVDQSSVRVGGKWEDRDKDAIEAAATWRYDFSYKAQPVEGVALSLKSMLPVMWLPWYLQGEMHADSTGADQEAVSLTADYHASDVSTILTTLGVTRRYYSKGARQRQGSYVVNTGCQWRQDDHLGIGISVKYYLDEHSVDSIFYLQFGLPVRAP